MKNMLSILPLTIFAVLIHGEELSSLHRNETRIVSSALDPAESVASQQRTSIETSLSNRSTTDVITPDHSTATVTSTTPSTTVTTSLLQDMAKTDVNETFINIVLTNQSSAAESKQEDNGQTHSHSGTNSSEPNTRPVIESCIGERCAVRRTMRIPIPQTVGGNIVSSLLPTPTSPSLETHQSAVPSTEDPTSAIRTTTTAPLVKPDHQVPVSSSSIGSNVDGYETTTSISSNVKDIGQVSVGVSMANPAHQERIPSTSTGSNFVGNEHTTIMSFNDNTDDSKHEHGAPSADANLKHTAASERNEMSKTLSEHPQSGIAHLSLTDLSILGVSVGFVVAVLVVVIVVVLRRHGVKKITTLNKESSRIDMRALRRNTINDVKASLVGIPSNGDIWLEMNKDSSIVV